MTEVWRLPCDLPVGTERRRRARTVAWLFGGFLATALVGSLLWTSGIDGLVLNLAVIALLAASFWTSFCAWRRGRAAVYFHPERVRVVPPAGEAGMREVELADVDRLWHRDTAFALYSAVTVVSFRVQPPVVDDVLEFLVDRLGTVNPACRIDVLEQQDGP